MTDLPEADAENDDVPDGSSVFVPLKAVSAASDDQPTLISSDRSRKSFQPSDPDLSLAPGQTLGQYELLGSVGVGGMAAVLKARDTELGRIVALKILPPSATKDPDGVTRFKQEARAAAKLDHDNIARVFACGEDRGLHFIAFELIDGDNLRTLIERRGTIPPEECVHLMVQVAAGLAHASERGVVHRDIKPSNIVVTPDGKAKIVDMGLARTLAAGVNGGVTQSGVTLGTFDYISPEQALDPRRADVRSDIYSLGCAFYHAATGRPPVPEGTAARKLFAHQHEAILDPREIVPTTPDEFAIVLSRMMAKDPQRRYQTPAALIQDLLILGERLKANQSGKPIPAGRPTASMPLAAWAGAAVLAAAVAVGISLSGSDSEIRLPTNDPSSKTNALALPSGPVVELGPPVASETAPQVVVGTVEALAAALRNPAVVEIQLEPGKRYDLAAIPAGLLAASRKSLTLDAKPGAGAPPILRIAATTPLGPPDAARPKSLTFARCGQLTLRRLTIEVFEPAAAPEVGSRPTGLVIVDCDKVELVECRLEAVEGEQANSDGVGVAIVNTTSQIGTLSLRHLYCGLRRATAFSLAGRIQATATECAFPAHTACFGLSGNVVEADGPGQLTLKHCSFLVEKGAVVELDPGARWNVTAGWCLFAAPPPDPNEIMMMPPGDLPERRPAVIRVLADKPTGMTFRGRSGERNVYYRIDPLAIALRGYSWDDVAASFPTEPALDADALELRTVPWAVDPLPMLTSSRPWEAFRLKSTLPGVRVPRSDVLLVGVKDLPRADVKLYDPWPPRAQDKPPDPRLKIIDPTLDMDGDEQPKNVYRTLESAVADAKPDDVLQLKINGLFEMPTLTLNKQRLRLTLQPFPGFKPILVPAKDAGNDSVLIRLLDGQLTLDGLEFRLRGRSFAATASTGSQSLVVVSGGRECRFRKCVVTMDERDGDACRVVHLPAAAGAVEPKMSFEQTLVRGRGRLLSAVDRAFDLDIKDAVVALQGPLLEMTAPVQEAIGDARISHVSVDQLTAVFASAPFVVTVPGAVAVPPLMVLGSRSVFASLDGAPLIQVRGSDEKEPRRIVQWTTQRSNWFSGLTSDWLVLAPRTPGLSKRFSEADWLDFTTEREPPTTVALTFRETPTRRNLATLDASAYAVTSVDTLAADTTECGARFMK